MSIVNEVDKIIGNDKDVLQRESLYVYQEYYNKLVQKGIIVKKTYTLPKIDTIGQYSFSSENKSGK